MSRPFKGTFDPSVVISFRVKVKSPLYQWLDAQQEAGKPVSDVVRDIMEAYEARHIEVQRWEALRRAAHMQKLQHAFYLQFLDKTHFKHWIRSRKLDYVLDKPSQLHVFREIDLITRHRESRPHSLALDSKMRSCCKQSVTKAGFAKWCLETPIQDEEE
jgi:hypothetical protein